MKALSKMNKSELRTEVKRLRELLDKNSLAERDLHDLYESIIELQEQLEDFGRLVGGIIDERLRNASTRK